MDITGLKISQKKILTIFGTYYAGENISSVPPMNSKITLTYRRKVGTKQWYVKYTVKPPSGPTQTSGWKKLY